MFCSQVWRRTSGKPQVSRRSLIRRQWRRHVNVREPCLLLLWRRICQGECLDVQMLSSFVLLQSSLLHLRVQMHGHGCDPEECQGSNDEEDGGLVVYSHLFEMLRSRPESVRFMALILMIVQIVMHFLHTKLLTMTDMSKRLAQRRRMGISPWAQT